VIEDGLKDLDKTLEINPEYDDAMSYENLLIRERAYLADTKEEYEQQAKIADAWLDKAMATKKSKEERRSSSRAAASSPNRQSKDLQNRCFPYTLAAGAPSAPAASVCVL